ncbi:PepSY domain-containing protein [Streptomyces sp. NPDC058632]|uniref:PepSY domain-containing protein n=1 Tax=unclassified Streptomyces TaxID=2593676 RepID=UPI0036515495
MNIAKGTARRRRGSAAVMGLCGAVAALMLLGACGDGEEQEHGRGDPFPMADLELGRAIRLSLAEVTGGELLSIELEEPESQSPVWQSTIATQDGATRIVRLAATAGRRVEEKPGPRLDSEARKALRALLERATLLPGEAALEARDSTDGPVTGVRLTTYEGEAVWEVDVTNIFGEEVTVHDVDARTGEVLRRYAPADQPE